MKRIGATVLACVALFSVTSFVVYATDPTQLQDLCVGTKDPNAALFVSGMFCKDPMAVTPEDFLAHGLDKPGNMTNKVGFSVNLVSATNLPGLNTLGISMARIDFAPNGLNPLHIHPRATEILTVTQGTLFVGFVTSNRPNGAPNQLFSKVLYPGDVYVFPQGLIHFQLNVGHTPAIAIAALSSQNPGVVTIANAVFGSSPPITPDVLTKAFRADKDIINFLQAQFRM